MKEYVNSQKFTSTTEIMEEMKAMFGDVLNQLMETELETKLRYEKVKVPRIMSKANVEKLPELAFKKDGKNAVG